MSQKKFVRAFILATWIYSFLIWAYVSAQIVINDMPVFDPFIYWIPISFYELGMITFIASFICMVVYLTFWGFNGSLMPFGKRVR